MKKSSALFAVLLLLNSAYATIHVTYVSEDVNPSTPRYYDLDLDGDNDFHFTDVDASPNTGTVKYYVNCNKPSSFYAAEGTTDTLAKAYSEGASLGTHHWETIPGLLATSTTGYFNNVSKYLMVKFSDGSNTYYGWFHIQESGWNMSIMAYGYSDVPDEMIKAGQTAATGIAEIAPSAFNLAKLTGHQIAFQSCEGYDRVGVYTLEGKKVTEINHPIAFNDYLIEPGGNMLLVSFFRKEKLLYSARYSVLREE